MNNPSIVYSNNTLARAEIDTSGTSVVGSTYAESDFDGFVEHSTTALNQKNDESTENSISYVNMSSHADYSIENGEDEVNGFLVANGNFNGDHFVDNESRLMDETAVSTIHPVDEDDGEPSIGGMCMDEVGDDSSPIDNDKKIIKDEKEQESNGSLRFNRLKKYNSWQKTRQSSLSPARPLDDAKYSHVSTKSNDFQKEEASPKTYKSRRSRLDKLRASPSPVANRFRSSSPANVVPPSQPSSTNYDVSSMTPRRLKDNFTGSLDRTGRNQSPSKFGNENDISMYTPQKKGYSEFRTPDSKDMSAMTPPNVPSTPVSNNRITDKLKALPPGHRLRGATSPIPFNRHPNEALNVTNPPSDKYGSPQITAMNQGNLATPNYIEELHGVVPPPPPHNPSIPQSSPPRYTSVGYLMDRGKSGQGGGFTYSFEDSSEMDGQKLETEQPHSNREHEPIQLLDSVNKNFTPSETTISPVDITMVSSGKSNSHETNIQIEKRSDQYSRSKQADKHVISEVKPKEQDDRTVSSIVSGTETLSSWWQSTYAKTHNPDVNSVVEKILSPGSDIDDDDEDVFSGIDAPDDETFGGATFTEVSVSSIDKTGGHKQKPFRNGAYNKNTSNSRRRISQLELVQEASEEDSPQKSNNSNMTKTSRTGAQPYNDIPTNANYSLKSGYESKIPTDYGSAVDTDYKRNVNGDRFIGNTKNDQKEKLGKDEYRSRGRNRIPVVKSKSTEDGDEYSYDATTFDLENPTIPVEWDQDSPGHATKTKVFSFTDLGCSVLDTVTLKACAVPTDEKGRRQLFDAKKKQIMTLLGNKFAANGQGDAHFSDEDDGSYDDLSNIPEEKMNVIDKTNSVDEVAGLSALTMEERRVWDDWDRKDVELPMPQALEPAIIFDAQVNNDESNIAEIDHEERRKQAHRELKYQAKSALVATEGTTNRPTESPENNNQPKANDRQQVSLSHQQFLDKFNNVLKSRGLEVLKLNSSSKWELRFLTVTKEIAWLERSSAGDSGDRMHVPQGLLWMKKFSSKPKDQSVSSIDKQGKGGMLFPKIISAAITSSNDNNIPIPKKFKVGKFNSPMIVTLIGCNPDGSSRTILFSFISKEDAKLFCSGCNLIPELTKK